MKTGYINQINANFNKSEKYFIKFSLFKTDRFFYQTNLKIHKSSKIIISYRNC